MSSSLKTTKPAPERKSFRENFLHQPFWSPIKAPWVAILRLLRLLFYFWMCLNIYILIIYLSMTFHLWQKPYEIPSCGSRDVISRYNPFITKISWCMTYHLLRRWLLRHYKGFGHYSLLSTPRFCFQERARGSESQSQYSLKVLEGWEHSSVGPLLRRGEASSW